VGDDSISRNERNEYLFHHLVAMFQTLALQQMGKLVNPITGKMERDLQQARITIDMLQMLRNRTTGNLEQSERMILDRALLELQMNFVDETAKGEELSPEPAEEQEREEPAQEKRETVRSAEAVEETGGEKPAAGQPEKGRPAAKEEPPTDASSAKAGADAPAAKKGKKESKAAKHKRGKKKKTD